jgi:LPXTG-motif cell wall-anchored protein
VNRSLVRRALALAAGTAVTTAVALAAAAPASAHHSIVSGDCARGADGAWIVTWTVRHTERDVPAELKTVVTSPAATLTVITPRALVPANGALTDTQVVPADVAEATLTVTAQWTRGDKVHNESDNAPKSATVRFSEKTCAPAAPTPSPTATPTPTATPPAGATPTPSATPAPGGGGGLPVTGASVGGTVAAAAVLLLVGVGLYLFARRRRIRFTA